MTDLDFLEYLFMLATPEEYLLAVYTKLNEFGCSKLNEFGCSS